MQNQSKKHLTFQSEEDVRRQNQTLTRLYKQLSLADYQEENSREEESLSDGIELAYQRMLSEPDEAAKAAMNKSGIDKTTELIVEESKEDKEVRQIAVKKVDASQGSIKSSIERMTPANEYDIIDSATNRYRATLAQVAKQPPQVVVK